MRGCEGSGRVRRHRGIIWVPRGPLGFVLVLLLAFVVCTLMVVVSALVLAAIVAAGLVFGAYRVGGHLLTRARERIDDRVVELGRRRPAPDATQRPLERYLANVEEFDHITTRAALAEPAAADSWRGRRHLRRLAERAIVLRESAISIERAVSRDRSADVARPGLWELIIAATELQRYLQDLLAFPTTRGRSAQMRELRGLQERCDEVVRRRDALIRRLQETDFREVSGQSAVGGGGDV